MYFLSSFLSLITNTEKILKLNNLESFRTYCNASHRIILSKFARFKIVILTISFKLFTDLYFAFQGHDFLISAWDNKNNEFVIRIDLRSITDIKIIIQNLHHDLNTGLDLFQHPIKSFHEQKLVVFCALYEFMVLIHLF